MEYLRLEINSNEDVWELSDKSLEHNLILNFRPHERIEWWNTDLKSNDGKLLKNLNVRDLQFDLQTNQEGVKEILDLNTDQFDIYQFDKPIADSLRILDLPENSRNEILKQNGLKHIFDCKFEVLEIRSFDVDFISKIRDNPKFKNCIFSE
jgi:hypothetical protein